MGFKAVEIEESKIVIEILIFFAKAPSTKPGLINSQL